MQKIRISDIDIDIEHKDIKNVHLSVYPPNGRVKISAPDRMSLDTIRIYAIDKLGWIRKQQKKFKSQDREAPREFLNMESHYYFGKRYLLKIEESALGNAKHAVKLHHNSILLTVSKQTSAKSMQKLLEGWYRSQLRDIADEYLENWSSIMGLDKPDFQIRKMKTKWGSFNESSRKIYINLELVKKPRECIEFIIVHELVHLIEPKHNDRFYAQMNKHLPKWQEIKEELNKLPLGHINWKY